MLIPLCITVITLVHKLCRAFSTLVFTDFFFFLSPGLSDKIKQHCINQASCCFYAKSSWICCFKVLDSKPELSFGLLTTWVCDIRRHKGLAASVVWAACPLHSQPGCKVMEGEEFGICLEAHSSVPWTEGHWVFIWVMGSMNKTRFNSCICCDAMGTSI